MAPLSLPSPPNTEPCTSTLAIARGLALRRGRVFADLWDLTRLKDCADCFDAREGRLRRINLEQRIAPPIRCSSCGGGL